MAVVRAATLAGLEHGGSNPTEPSYECSMFVRLLTAMNFSAAHCRSLIYDQVGTSDSSLLLSPWPAVVSVADRFLRLELQFCFLIWSLSVRLRRPPYMGLHHDVVI